MAQSDGSQESAPPCITNTNLSSEVAFLVWESPIQPIHYCSFYVMATTQRPSTLCLHSPDFLGSSKATPKKKLCPNQAEFSGAGTALSVLMSWETKVLDPLIWSVSDLTLTWEAAPSIWIQDLGNVKEYRGKEEKIYPAKVILPNTLPREKSISSSTASNAGGFQSHSSGLENVYNMWKFLALPCTFNKWVLWPVANVPLSF